MWYSNADVLTKTKDKLTELNDKNGNFHLSKKQISTYCRKVGGWVHASVHVCYI